jgi:rhamnulokinase
MKKMIAFDFGATSGRGIVGTFDGNRLSLEEFSRFSNPVCQIREHIYVDFLSMYSRVCEGLMSVFDAESLGICSWSADFALFDKYDMLI